MAQPEEPSPDARNNRINGNAKNAIEKINSGARHRIIKVRFDIIYPLGPYLYGPI
tara:strand:- start:277 stop:441 length:165 start_codon:yes stop_codon:yes gene_type:complete